ncbi:MAG: hypothetical protein QOF37_806 [Thermoleophilaceae bacterium]|jgi:hypothetical protein|nr:hypothetical protein [Thermoleophilaceae bacterium]
MDEPTENRNLPVLASAPEARTLERPPETMTLTAPVVAATGGVLAGLATFALFRIMRGGLRRGPAAVRIGRGRRRAKLDIAGSRSFLVDVHVLNKR